MANAECRSETRYLVSYVEKCGLSGPPRVTDHYGEGILLVVLPSLGWTRGVSELDGMTGVGGPALFHWRAVFYIFGLI